MTTESTTETTTDTERRILAILAEATTDGFMPWAEIRDQLPAGFWRRINALDALHQSGAVEVFEAVAVPTSASPMRSPARRTGHQGRAVPWCSPDWPILERNNP